jgi:hypothetical protein
VPGGAGNSYDVWVPGDLAAPPAAALPDARAAGGWWTPRRLVGLVLWPSPAVMRRIALAGLAASGAIVLTGAAVRLSQSGLGCTPWWSLPRRTGHRADRSHGRAQPRARRGRQLAAAKEPEEKKHGNRTRDDDERQEYPFPVPDMTAEGARADPHQQAGDDDGPQPEQYCVQCLDRHIGRLAAAHDTEGEPKPAAGDREAAKPTVSLGQGFCQSSAAENATKTVVTGRAMPMALNSHTCQ